MLYNSRMDRIYTSILEQHLANDRQMVFLAGPRQVGKTTISKATTQLTDHFVYLNWDFIEDQTLILQGPQALINQYELTVSHPKKTILVLDEIHKYKQWRNFLKGFYDKYNETIHFIVTGSAKLDVYRQTGDSLMGRYFPYRVHPLSVAELLRTSPITNDIQPPAQLEQQIFENLLNFGGLPEPFSKNRLS